MALLHSSRLGCVAILALLALACGSATAPAEQLPPSESDFVFDPDVVRTYSITMTAADWDLLFANPRAEEYLPATLSVEGVEYAQVALRYKGSAGTLRNCVDLAGNRSCAKLSFKMKFSEYDSTKRFFGLKRLNFNSNISDLSLVRERLAYSLFEDMGIASPRTGYARLVVNGVDQGIFGLAEQIDGRFTRRHFGASGGDGNLYKEVWPVYADEAFFLEGLKTNRNEAPSADKMVRMAQDLLAASDEDFAEVLARWLDVDHLITQIALDRAMDHSDGILAFYCWGGGHFNHNFYIYEDPLEDRVQIIPWDFDRAFQTPNPYRQAGVPEWTVLPEGNGPCPTFLSGDVALSACDPIVARLSTLLWDRFATRGQAVLDEAFDVARMQGRIESWAQLVAPEVASDSALSIVEWRADVDELKVSLPALRERFAQELQGL